MTPFKSSAGQERKEKRGMSGGDSSPAQGDPEEEDVASVEPTHRIDGDSERQRDDAAATLEEEEGRGGSRRGDVPC